MYTLMSLDKCICLYDHHFKQHIEYFPHPESILMPFCSQLPHSHLWFLSLGLILSVSGLHVNGIMQNMLFLFLLLPLNNVSEFQPQCCLYQWSLLFHWWVVFHGINKYTTICLFTSWWTYGLFPAFSGSNKAAMNSCIEVFLGQMHRSRTVRLKGSVFNVRNCQLLSMWLCLFTLPPANPPAMLTAPAAPDPTYNKFQPCWWVCRSTSLWFHLQDYEIYVLQLSTFSSFYRTQAIWYNKRSLGPFLESWILSPTLSLNSCMML